jgi:hypothetical protein
MFGGTVLCSPSLPNRQYAGAPRAYNTEHGERDTHAACHQRGA